MKYYVTLLLLTLAFAGQAQFTPKGKSFYKQYTLSAKADVPRIWGDSIIYSSYTNSYSDVYSDTVYYEMTENDTVSLSLMLNDDFRFVPEDFSFEVQFVYGNPFSSVESNGVSAYGYGFNKSVDMRFADTALFTFCGKGNGIPSHLVKLSRKQKQLPPSPAYQLQVYPNPAANLINIDLTIESATSFSLVNAEGRQIAFWTGYGSHQKDLSDLQSGIYFLQFSNAMESSVIKLEKIR